MKHNITTILLDVDGTLLDFDEAERLGVRQVLKHYGIASSKRLEQRYCEINKSYWKSFERGEIPKSAIIENRFVDFFHTLGITIDHQEVEHIFRNHLDSCAILLDGALEICQYLKEGYKLYVVTNGVASTQYRRLKDSTLDQYFTDIFVSEEIGSQKPQKEYFDYCLARITETDPSRVMIIGDSITSDMQGGIDAGLVTCWFNPERHNLPRGMKVDYMVEQLKEIRRFL